MARVLGLAGASNNLDDALVLGSAFTWNFDPNNRGAAGGFDAIGAISTKSAKAVWAVSVVSATRTTPGRRWTCSASLRPGCATSPADRTASRHISRPTAQPRSDASLSQLDQRIRPISTASIRRIGTPPAIRSVRARRARRRSVGHRHPESWTSSDGTLPRASSAAR